MNESYTSFAQVYDMFMDNVDYPAWSKYLIQLLKEYQVEDGLVLDLGCGTGNMTELLAKEGYDMIGVDNSEDMLEIASEKRAESGLNILYLLQDMREFELYGTVKAVVSICDSINYILEEDDLREVFSLVNNYLDPKGMFIFDLNTKYKYEQMGETTIAENREEASFIWDNYYDPEEEINEYELAIFIPEGEDSDLYRKFEEVHYQRAYDHGYPFATNFNPEINLREVSAPGSYWENGHWVEIPPMSIKREYNFDEVGEKDMYLLHHEEIEALAKNIPGVKRIRFFMTFGQSYLTHMKCLENVGLLSTTPITFNGQQIVPIQFLKELLPDPSTLGPRTVGKTNIGCIFTGIKDGKERSIYIYNVCDHQECYREVESQAISYTTGVPAMIGTMMVVSGLWNKPGVYTTDEFDPDPYMEALNKWGLPWKVVENPVLVD